MTEHPVTPREVIMRAISTAPGTAILEGYAPLCLRIERALAEAGFLIIPGGKQIGEPVSVRIRYADGTVSESGTP